MREDEPVETPEDQLLDWVIAVLGVEEDREDGPGGMVKGGMVIDLTGCRLPYAGSSPVTRLRDASCTDPSGTVPSWP